MTESVSAANLRLFFRKVICDYNCGDVRHLLDQKTPALVACSPKPDPFVMRVQESLGGARRTLDVTTTEAT